jgi:hypothetical protein
MTSASPTNPPIANATATHPAPAMNSTVPRQMAATEATRTTARMRGERWTCAERGACPESGGTRRFSVAMCPNDQVNRRPALQPAEEEDAYPGVRLNAMLGSNA